MSELHNLQTLYQRSDSSRACHVTPDTTHTWNYKFLSMQRNWCLPLAWVGVRAAERQELLLVFKQYCLFSESRGGMHLRNGRLIRSLRGWGVRHAVAVSCDCCLRVCGWQCDLVTAALFACTICTLLLGLRVTCSRRSARRRSSSSFGGSCCSLCGGASLPGAASIGYSAGFGGLARNGEVPALCCM